MNLVARVSMLLLGVAIGAVPISAAAQNKLTLEQLGGRCGTTQDIAECSILSSWHSITWVLGPRTSVQCRPLASSQRLNGALSHGGVGWSALPSSLLTYI